MRVLWHNGSTLWKGWRGIGLSQFHTVEKGLDMLKASLVKRRKGSMKRKGKKHG